MADEFLAMEDLPKHAELVAGEVVVTSPTVRHQAVCMQIAYELETWNRTDNSGRGLACHGSDVVIGRHDVYVPDVVLYLDRSAIIDAPLRDAPLPDLAVEVRSPSTWHRDVGPKLAGYQARGVRELWLVDGPARTVLTFRRSAADATAFDVTGEVTDVVRTPLLPGFAPDVGALLGD